MLHLELHLTCALAQDFGPVLTILRFMFLEVANAGNLAAQKDF